MEPEDRTEERRSLTRWLALSVGVLVPAGLFALVIALARTPPLSGFITDPQFFRRCLVVHVVLALVAWSCCYVTALVGLLPSRDAGSALRRQVALTLSVVGVGLIAAGAATRGSRPILSNYVPVIDHPVFTAGLCVLGFGLALGLLDRRLLPGTEVAEGVFPLPASARPGIRAAALALLVALVTFAIAAAVTPSGFDPAVRAELVAWGGGHAMQVSLEAAMVAVWLVLLGRALGRDVVSRGVSALAFGALLLPTLAMPALAATGTTTSLYRQGCTALMRWGIFPAVTVMLALCVRALARVPRGERAATLRDPRVMAFATSAALAVAGFVLGAMIRGSNTLVPAHYHAATGAVTVAFMAMTFELAPALDVPLPEGRARCVARWQPVAYGAAQLSMALGFALAGAHGVARKVYGAEQHVRTTAEYAGLGLMGLGGLLAVLSGVGFLVILAAAWSRRVNATPDRSDPWTPNPTPTRSSG